MTKNLRFRLTIVKYINAIMFLTPKVLTLPARGGAWLLAAAGFAAGLTAGALIAPVGASRGVEAPVAAPQRPATSAWRGGHAAQMLPTQVLRVIDGDTFEARVRIWPGMDVTTKVRLRGIDAPEMHARCGDERAKALAARARAGANPQRRRGRYRAGATGQIWRPRRCRGLDRLNGRRLRHHAFARAGAALFGRKAR